jgi:hypothetical protein
MDSSLEYEKEVTGMGKKSDPCYRVFCHVNRGTIKVVSVATKELAELVKETVNNSIEFMYDSTSNFVSKEEKKKLRVPVYVNNGVAYSLHSLGICAYDPDLGSVDDYSGGCDFSEGFQSPGKIAKSFMDVINFDTDESVVILGEDSREDGMYYDRLTKIGKGFFDADWASTLTDLIKDQNED